MILEYNLQFFAKDGPGGEKTEKPTDKRRKEAREEGQVAKSNEITTSISLITAFSTLALFTGYMYKKLREIFNESFRLSQYVEEFDFNNTVFVSKIIGEFFSQVLLTVLPFMAIGFIMAFVTSFLQVGWHPTLKPLKPKFERINPLKGFKRLFSLRVFVELLKSILKVVIISLIIYTTINGEIDYILNLFDHSVEEICVYMMNIIVKIGLKVGVFYVIVAAIDYGYQKYEHEQNLKMTKQEIKEEYKMQEGNPEVKRKIKQKMREVSMRRMMQELPKADVIITNPTHFAVAIQYDTEVSDTPLVLAKGADLVAKRIKEIAKENNIEIVENKPLARTLYYTVDIGQEIPPELYQAVAEVLAFVYKLKNRSV